jgi:hypothetical protein
MLPAWMSVAQSPSLVDPIPYTPFFQMAIVSNSYLYHMRKDLVENIEPGVAQVRLRSSSWL